MSTTDEKIRHTPGPWVRRKRGGPSNMIEGPSGFPPKYDGDDGLRPLALFQPCCSSELYDEQEANGEANATLIALAPTAPHSCDVPGCPGAENKRRLEEMEDACRRALEIFYHAFPDRDFQAGPPHQRFAMLLTSLERRLEAYPALVSAVREAVDILQQPLANSIKACIDDRMHDHSLQRAVERAMNVLEAARAEALRKAGEHE